MARTALMTETLFSPKLVMTTSNSSFTSSAGLSVAAPGKGTAATAAAAETPHFSSSSDTKIGDLEDGHVAECFD